MSQNLSFKMLCGQILWFFHVFQIQIHHLMAAGADYMIMRGDLSVEAVSTIAGTDFLNFSDICQQRQVTVDGSETDVRINLA